MDIRRRTSHGATLFLALWSAPLAAQKGPWALTNARIETVTHGVIERGTVLIRDGLIRAVGASVTVPPDAQVLDLAGRTISPGLIDLISSTGLPTVAVTPSTPGAPGTPPAPQGLEPERMVADQVRISPSDAQTLRKAGITAVLVSPARGLFRGQSALVPARDSAGGEDAIRSPVAQHVGYQGVGSGEYPGSLLGVIAMQRQMFYDARRYGQLEDRWRADPNGVTRPERNPKLEALVPSSRGTEPVWIDARNENEIRRATRLARELGLALTVAGATEGWRARDALTGVGVVVSLDFPRPSDVTGWRFRTGLLHTADDSVAAEQGARKLIEGNAAALNTAGIRFALSSGGRPADLLANAHKAIAAGLPAGVALEALTMRAAELAGVPKALGSIEAGKIANLVVSNGPLLADSAKVLAVFVDGERYVVSTGSPASTSSTPSTSGTPASTPPANLAGVWVMTTNSPQGTVESTLTIQQQGSSFSGSSVSQMGTAQVSDGQVNGKKATWTLVVSFGGGSLTLNYSADIDGNRMSGNVAAGDFGTFPFTGEKKP